MRRGLLLGSAAVIYVLAAWAVKPGFYDGGPVPQYDYVSPPVELVPSNVPPTSGSGRVGAAGGTVTTRDEPFAQAGVRVPTGALAADTTITIQPYAPPRPAGVITLEGNVYCITAGEALNPGSKVEVTLFIPASEPFPSAMYYAPSRDAEWKSIGGTVDLNTYLMPASAPAFGCFAVGYPTPKQGGPGIRGSIVPLVTAVLIAVVVLAGLPLALRRRRYNRR